MAETQSRPRLVRFGAFEADVQTGELRKDGVKLKFSGQPFQVLVILLERPGDVVTREDLQKRLWPDTFVDVERNLNTAVNKIREVLGDSAESPRFIETLSRRGYRFIGALEPLVQPEVPVEPIRTSSSPQTWLKIAVGIFTLAILVVGAVAMYRWFRRQLPTENRTENAPLTALPFTALPGEETSPAFSPDGSRIAFAWNGDPGNGGKGFDLYVKAIGSETLLRLTHNPSEWISSAWSPDGTQIAFHRLAGANSGIYVVPALGGPERKLRSTRTPWAPFQIISWSPDGRWIAFSDLYQETEHNRIYLLSTETWEPKRNQSLPDCVGEGLPAFSHNGKYLAYWCFRSINEWGLYSLPLSGGQPKLISLFRDIPQASTWSPDDKELIYSLGDGPHDISEVSVANGSVKRLALAGNVDQAAVSPKGDKLAYRLLSVSSSIWRRDLLHPASPIVELVPSTRSQYDAQYSPDGKQIAFASERSGVQGVWVSDVEGSNLVQISNPHDVSGSPQWSPDGKEVAFDSRPVDHWEIYLADVADRIPRRLVTNLSDIFQPRWSRDGKWIYFRSEEVGKQGMYRCPAAGGDAVALSKEADAYGPHESPDGATLYFLGGFAKLVLKKVPLVLGHPGPESEVEGFPRVGSDFGPWTVSPKGIYFVLGNARRSFRYFDFATKQVHEVFAVNKDFGSGLSVSPDGRWIIYSLAGETSSEIMLVDHFH